jgi:inosine/xanthosine triphosphatase
MSSKVIVGSLNKVKVNAIKSCFKAYDVIGMDAQSLVSAQPYGDDETMLGAINRAKEAKKQGDIGIGLEGGVAKTPYGIFVISYGALIDQFDNLYLAGGTRVPLPREVEAGLSQGLELGEVMDLYAKKANVKHDEGAVGILTNNRVKRQAIFEHIGLLLLGQMELNKNAINIKGE